MLPQIAAERADSVGPNPEHRIGNGLRLPKQNLGLERSYTSGHRGGSVPDRLRR